MAIAAPRVSVILTAWNRPQYLEEQVHAVFSQTVPPCEVVLWYNQPPPKLGIVKQAPRLGFREAERVRKIVCDHNFGIFPRFAIAPCLDGDYICIFDDDTLPGVRWFENCLRFIEAERAMLGTIGLRFVSLEEHTVVTEKPRMGWEAGNRQIEFVDVVGHSWFFKKSWAPLIWKQPPISMGFGEDIHFCAMLQKSGIRCACPPHPPEDKTLWGSTRPERGVDKVAISCSADRSREYYEVVEYEIKKGFKPILL